MAMWKRKWLKYAAMVLAAVVPGDVTLSLALRIGRIQRALTRRLETAFGRPVQVGHFNFRVVPSPRLEAVLVTVGEDPAFGYEYFLRAERVTAGLRWGALLRGRLEFATFSFTRPSLTLVRNDDGRWNLERWLPPGKTPPIASGFVGPMPAPASGIRPVRVDFDDGRVNFMSRETKLPFAFAGVNGSAQQEAPGRWKLSLEAKPFRSGASLQAAGRLFVRGEIAGTSARLRPAEIHLHWGEASLADLLRLARGRDFGLRGDVLLDALIRSGMPNMPDAPAGSWTFSLQARAKEIHRWDLTGRRDNPAVNLLVNGKWNVPANSVRIEQIVAEGPRSNARGAGEIALSGKPSFELRVNSAGIQASDALAWYRAFVPGVSENVTAEGYLTAAATLDGWPLALRNAAFSSPGASLRVPGVKEPVRISAIEGGRRRDRLVLDPVKLDLGARAEPRPAAPSAKLMATRGRARAAEEKDTFQLSAAHEITSGHGFISIEGSAEHVENLLAAAAALGRSIGRGWELEGKVTTALRWEGGVAPRASVWNGHMDFSENRLQVAGLNSPLEVHGAQLVWKEGRRSAHLESVEGFGAQWSGDLEADQPLSTAGERGWKFRLHAARIDAVELDRWAGPRARPSWLARLLPTLLGNPAQEASASELIRRIRAEGELRVNELRIEKLRLTDVEARATLHDLRLEVQDANAGWAGGKVSGSMSAEFAPRPHYTVDAKLDRVHLAELMSGRGQGERLDSIASGELKLSAEGVGRDELLRTLEGSGRVELRNVELRGWDLAASLAEGAPRTGASRWNRGEGAFAIRDRAILFDALRLDAPQGPLFVRGSVGFGSTSDLSFERKPAPSRGAKRLSDEPGMSHVVKMTGPLAAPRVTVERSSF